MRSIALSRTSRCTLLLITRERLVRADFSAGSAPVLVDLQQRARPETDDLALLVDTALRLGKKRAKRVYILSSDLWVQTIRMPADTIRGLADNELSRALCFEAEPLSGIPAIESQVAMVPLPSTSAQRDFWIVQASNFDVSQADDAVHHAGGRLQGLLHPSGIGWPPNAQHETAWRRVELWPGAVFCQRQAPGAATQTHVVNADPAQRGWQATVDAWLGDADPANPVQWLLPDAGVMPPPEATNVVDLDDETALRTWLTGWAGQLSAPAIATPLLRPAPRPMSKQRRQAITVGLAAAAAIGCFGHYTWNNSAIASLTEQSKLLNAQVTAFTATKKQATDLASKVEKARTQLDAVSHKVQDTQGALNAHRQRWQKLLKLLSDLRPRNLLVQKIDSSGEKLNISGLCIGPHPANELASDLGERVGRLGWQVQPAKQESDKRLTNGEPWKFDLVLTDLPMAKAVAAAEPRALPRPVGPQGPVNKVVSFQEEMMRDE
jgi:Tfp pilus assembly protein PilN